MRYSEFLKGIQAGSIQPVITFLGEEAFLKDRALETVVKRFLDPASRSLQFRSLAADELRDSSFLDDAATTPMFGDWKILYLKNAAVLEKSLSRIKDYLESYLKSPSPTTILIFDLDAWEGASKLKGILNKQSTVVEFNPLSEKEIPSWIITHLRALGFQMESSAIEALTERLGTDLQKISAELEKLMLFRHTEKKIALGDVESMVGYSPTANVWQWTDALMERDIAKATSLLDDLLLAGEQPVMIIALLAKQYEKMIIAKEMVNQKVPQPAIAQKINKPVYYLQKYLNQLATFSMKDLVKAMQVLSYTDRALKSSQAAESTILHLMATQLCNLKAAAPPVFDVPLQ